MSKGEATRQRILEKAAPIFNRRGYAGCSLQQIMDATGLEKGGIYRHFSSKEELAAEAFDYAWKTVSAARRQGLDSIADPAARLKQHFANFLDGPSPIPGGCPLLNTGTDADDGNPVLRERVQRALGSWQTMIAEALEQGIDSSLFRPGIDTHAAANHIIGTIEGALLLGRVEQSNRPIRQAVAQLNAYLELDLKLPKRDLSPLSA